MYRIESLQILTGPPWTKWKMEAHGYKTLAAAEADIDWLVSVGETDQEKDRDNYSTVYYEGHTWDHKVG